MRYYIYSYEHKSWWRPYHNGYTQDLSEAGQYTAEEAIEIAFNANRFSASIQEIIVHPEDAERFQAHMRTRNLAG